MNSPSESYPVKTDRAIATIAASSSLSDAIDLIAGTPVKIRIPAIWDSANITFQESFSGNAADFKDFYHDTGTEFIVVAATNRTIKIDPADFVGIRFLKIRSGTSGSPVIQTNQRQIEVIRTVL